MKTIKIFGEVYARGDVDFIASDINERWDNVKKWHAEDKDRHDKTINSKNKELALLSKVLLKLAHSPSTIFSGKVKKALSSSGIEIKYQDDKAFLNIK